MIKIKTEFKYRTSFKGPFEIVQTWKNESVILQIVAVKTRVNILRIKPHNILYKKLTSSINTKYKHTYITNIYTCNK